MIDPTPSTPGPWLKMRSGKYLSLMYPDPRDIDVWDVACSLAKLPRFAGHTRYHYSVAAHSMLVAKIVRHLLDIRPGTATLHELQGLCHDATECVTGDIPTPVKIMVPDIARYETDVLWPTFAAALGVRVARFDAVARADTLALIVETDAIGNGIPAHGPEQIRSFADAAKWWAANQEFHATALEFIRTRSMVDDADGDADNFAYRYQWLRKNIPAYTETFA